MTIKWEETYTQTSAYDETYNPISRTTERVYRPDKEYKVAYTRVILKSDAPVNTEWTSPNGDWEGGTSLKMIADDHIVDSGNTNY